MPNVLVLNEIIIHSEMRKKHKQECFEIMLIQIIFGQDSKTNTDKVQHAFDVMLGLGSMQQQTIEALNYAIENFNFLHLRFCYLVDILLTFGLTNG